jgi:hypothetical protein
VEEVGFEAMEFIFDEFGVTPKDGIEGKIFFHADGGGGAWKFEGAELSVVEQKGVAGTGADAHEGELMALGIGDEVAAGVGDSVYFMEGIGKIGNAREPHGFTVSRLDDAKANGRINPARKGFDDGIGQ